MIALIDDPRLARLLVNLGELPECQRAALCMTAEKLAQAQRDERAMQAQGNVITGPWKGAHKG